MPHRRSRAAVAVALCALVSAAFAAGAPAASKPVALRVLTSTGRTLADYIQYTDDVRVRATRRAKCFGPDSPSSNDAHRVDGATLLGVLGAAAQHDRSLAPLRLNDAFVDDGFGLGVCGIGGIEAPYGFPAPFWYSAVDGTGASTGPDLVPVKSGDEALWYYTNGNESGFPSELLLNAPARVRAGTPFTVRVVAAAGDGTRSPAAGVDVTGASAPTGADGRTSVTLAASRALRATGGVDDVPSARLPVCVKSGARSACPRVRGLTIFGSGAADTIKASAGDDTVDARAGRDVVDITRGGSDTVDCGPGNDRVIVSKGDHDDTVKASCERVIKR